MTPEIPEEIQRLVEDGELQSVDFKAPMSFKPGALATKKLAKHIIGMANTRGGGVILIGVREEADKSLTPIGLEEHEAKSFDPSIVNEYVEKYAAPSPRAQVTTRIENGKRFVRIRIPGFSEVPLVVTKTLSVRVSKKPAKGAPFEEEPIFRAGDVLIRTTNATTRRVYTEREMRELIEMSLQKRAIFDAPIAGKDMDPRDWSIERDNAKWREPPPVRGGAGTWDLVLHPPERMFKKLSYSDLKRMVAESQASLTGRGFPQTRPENEMLNRSCPEDSTKFVRHESRYPNLYEMWSFFATGYFQYFRFLEEDIPPPPEGERRILYWQHALFTIAEFVIFASKLYSRLNMDGIHYAVRLTQANRTLVSLPGHAFSVRQLPRDCVEAVIDLPGILYPSESCKDPTPKIVEITCELFGRFQWDEPAEDILRGHLDDLYHRRF